MAYPKTKVVLIQEGRQGELSTVGGVIFLDKFNRETLVRNEASSRDGLLGHAFRVRHPKLCEGEDIVKYPWRISSPDKNGDVVRGGRV